MRIAILFNLGKENSMNNFKSDDDAEYDSIETIQEIKKSLEAFGHKTFLIEADENCYLKIKRLSPKIDFVFNIAEGLIGSDREAQVPAMLEMLGIPYTGAGPFGAALTLNKAKTKEILMANSIPTPPFQLFKTGKEKLSSKLNFPLIVKPNQEGSSKGIKSDSVVRNKRDLYKKINWIIKKYNQPALAEKFLAGEEYSVGLLGNDKNLEVLPIIRVNFSSFKKGEEKIDSYENKIRFPQSANLVECPANISRIMEQKLKEISLRTFEAVQCYDWARIDIRCDEKGNPHVLEVNPFPAIDPRAEINPGFPQAVWAAGLSYQQMIGKIISAAVKRYRK